MAYVARVRAGRGSAGYHRSASPSPGESGTLYEGLATYGGKTGLKNAR
jgi:hypothetical protein